MKNLINSITKELFMDLIYDINCIRKISMGNPTVVYQLGKVGSRSIFNSLKSAGVKPLFHTHFLNYYHMSRPVRRLYNEVFVLSVPTNIISLTREPFSRNVSSFFERFSRIKPGKKVDQFSVMELINIFFEKYYYQEPLLWFDSELERVTGFDVYDHTLVDNEYLTAKKNNFDILVLKSELPNNRKEFIIAQFLKLDNFKILDVNVTKEKKYAKVYKAFKKNIVYERKYVDEIVNSKYFKHFYENEKEDILKKLRIKK